MQHLDRVRDKNRNRIAVNSVKRVKFVFCIILFITVLVALLYSDAALTEQCGELEKRNSTLIELNSEYTYLNFEIESRTSLKNVEEYAVRELGLIKTDRSRIEYVQLKNENEIVVTEAEFLKWQRILLQNFHSIMEYLNP